MPFVEIHEIILQDYSDLNKVIDLYNLKTLSNSYLVHVYLHFRLKFGEYKISNNILIGSNNDLYIFKDYVRLMFLHKEFIIKLLSKNTMHEVYKYHYYKLQKHTKITENKLNKLKKIFNYLDQSLENKDKLVKNSILLEDPKYNKNNNINKQLILNYFKIRTNNFFTWNTNFNYINIFKITDENENPLFYITFPFADIVLDYLPEELIYYLMNANFDKRFDRLKIKALSNI